MPYHAPTFRLLGKEPKISAAERRRLDDAEDRLGIKLPPSLREWYERTGAIRILAEHSNEDPPIPVDAFTLEKAGEKKLLPIRYENQGVCVWGVDLNGSADPPVMVDVDEVGWMEAASTFSEHVYSCVWDYRMVMKRAALVQAQNPPLSPAAIAFLQQHLTARAKTFAWPADVQYRWEGPGFAILIRNAPDQADWFIGAGDEAGLHDGLKLVWEIDGVGKNLYDCNSEIAARVLQGMK